MPKVAVLGAGIMGSSTALLLARRGVGVTLYDAASEPFSGASRWNEGKIHLGFLYSGDPSFRTAERLLPGGLAFKPLVEELLGQSLGPATTDRDDIFLIHRDSVVSPDTAHAYYDRLAKVVRSMPDAARYLTDASRAVVRRLSVREIEALAEPEQISAGFTVPERSVSTRWVADAFQEVLATEPRVELRTGTRILSVCSAEANWDSRLIVETSDGRDGPFDHVVNALWANRLVVDNRLGLRPPSRWSHRYRLCLFVRTRRPVSVPSVLVCTGPFGDIKSYTPHDFYVSWYPDGLMASGEDVEPPPLPELSHALKERIAERTFHGLGRIVTRTREIASEIQELTVEGGWVFALGQGSLSDAQSQLHRRDRIGIQRRGAYFSVDTGKYSVAPWLAREIVRAITGG